MRVFIAVLVLIFSLQSWTKADDISDFEIEGMSVGDSLLDYFSEKVIKNNLIDYDYKDKEFSTAEFFKTDFYYELYDIVIVNFKANDKNYIIYAVGGVVDYKNINKCYEEKNKIAEEISSLLKDAKKEEDHKVRTKDPNAEFMSYIWYFTKEGDRVSIECYDLKPENTYNSPDQLRIGILEHEFVNWLITKAWRN
jgi:hypothetical protein